MARVRVEGFVFELSARVTRRTCHAIVECRVINHFPTIIFDIISSNRFIIL